MPATYTTINIDGGPSSASLTDPDNIQLQEQGYSIQSPKRRLGGMAGSTPYEDVIETIRVNIYGATGAAVLANKELLEQILDQAARWNERRPETAITIEALPQGSAFASPMTSVIKGGRVNLPDQYFDKLMVNAIEGVELEIERLPVWLGDEEVSGPSSAANVPTKVNLAFIGDVEIPSPVELLLSGFSAAQIVENWLLTAENSADIAIVNAQSAVDNTVTGIWTTKADVGKNSRSGTIGQWGAGSTNWEYVSFISLGLAGKTLDIFAAIRQNDSGVTWQLKLDSLALTSGAINDESRAITLDYNAGKPQIVPIGRLISADQSHDLVNLYFRVSDDTGGPTLDMDYIVFLISDPDGNQAIHCTPSTSLSISKLTYDHRLLTKPDPAIVLNAATTPALMGYDTPPIVFSKGTNLTVIWLACYDDQWVHTPTSKAAPSSITFRAARREAFLSPT